MATGWCDTAYKCSWRVLLTHICALVSDMAYIIYASSSRASAYLGLTPPTTQQESQVEGNDHNNEITLSSTSEDVTDFMPRWLAVKSDSALSTIFLSTIRPICAILEGHNYAEVSSRMKLDTSIITRDRIRDMQDLAQNIQCLSFLMCFILMTCISLSLCALQASLHSSRLVL